MSTALQGVYTAPTCTNLTQNFSITEGATAVDLQPFVLTTGVNYSRVYTLTMTIAAPYQAANISLVCGALNGLAFTRVGNVYTLSSEYTAANGVKINNWAYFKIALQSINVTLSNSDFSDSFTITSVLTDGSTTLSGVINVYTQAQIDVVGATQTVYMPMASNNMSLVDMGGVNLAIADPAQANKTYRVTLTVNDNSGSNLYFHIRNNLIGYDSGWQKTIVLSGTQTYINSLLVPTVGDTASGIRFNNYAPDFSGYVSISYLQEVLTTNEPVPVPYVQEGGTIGVQVAYTAPMSLGGNITYVEDSSVTFDLGNITDPAGFYWAHETCGEHAGYNCYTLTATALGTYTAENPVQLTFSGDVAINNTVTFTGTRDQVNSAINALTLIPPADHVGQIDVGVVLTRGNTPVTILDTVIAATCSSTHGDINIIAGTAFVVGTTDIDFGSITDLAVGKQYTITIDAVTDSATRGALSDTTGTGVWSAAGGVNGFGRLTISGSKSVVNASLAALRYTTAVGATGNETQSFVYTQTQTTNNILQGTVNILFANSIIWNSGNGVNAGQNAFVYDQDKPETFNLATLSSTAFDDVTTYTAKLIFSTPLTVDNLGSVTDWTRETDYIWTKTGIRADLNIALSAVQFTPAAALVSNFTLDIAIWAAGVSIKDTVSLGSTKTVYIRSMISVAWTGSALSYNQGSVTTWSLATLNTYSAPRVYTLRLITSVPTTATITGWTTINSTTFERADTRANLQTALNSLVFTPTDSFVSNFSFSTTVSRSGITLYSNPANTKTISIGVLYSIEIPPYAFNYNQDTTLTFSLGTLSNAFNDTDTYTVSLSAKLTSDGSPLQTGSVGSFTGWTTSGSYNFIKSGTKTQITAAMASIEWIPIEYLYYDINFNVSILRGATVLATSLPIYMTIDQRYSVTPTSAALSLDQNGTSILNNMFILSSLYSDPRTYKFTIRASDAAQTAADAISTITGWTKTGQVFEKIGTGNALVTAINSLEITTSESIVTGYMFAFTPYRLRSGGPYVPLNNENNAKTVLLDERYSFTRAVIPQINYGGATTVVNLGSINEWFTNQAEIQLTIPAIPNVTISSNLVTGDRTAINNFLAAVSVTTTAFQTASFQFQLIFKIKNDLNAWVQCMPTQNTYISITNIPTISYVDDLYYIIGGPSKLTMAVTNVIPSHTYVLKVESSGSGLFGNDSSLNTPTNDWSYVSTYYTTDQLADTEVAQATTDITLVTRSDSTLGESVTSPTIRYSFTPWTTVAGGTTVLPWKSIKNGALINVNTFEETWVPGVGYLTNPVVLMMPPIAYYQGPVSTTINLGSYTQPNGIMYLDEGTEHSISVQFLGSFYTYNAPGYGNGAKVDSPLTLTGWTNFGNGLFGLSGLPSTLNTALSSLTFNNDAFLTILWQGEALQYIDCIIKTSNAGSGVIATQTVRLLVRTIV